MHSTRAHHDHHFFGPHWSTANAAITLLLVLLFLIFLLLVLMMTAQPLYAQRSVPATARQAATMPQVAARLRAGAARNGTGIGHSYHLQGAYRNPCARSREARCPPMTWFTQTGRSTARLTRGRSTPASSSAIRSQSPSGGANLSALTFGAWLSPGDVLQSAEVSITDSEFGGTTYFDGVVNFTQSGCIGNQYGFNVCTETGNFTLNNLAPGTYWLNLQNASVNTGIRSTGMRTPARRWLRKTRWERFLRRPSHFSEPPQHYVLLM